VRLPLGAISLAKEGTDAFGFDRCPRTARISLSERGFRVAGNTSVPGTTVTSRLLAIVGAFDERHRSMTLTELARRSGTRVPTAHRLVGELVAGGALQRLTDGRYAPGPLTWQADVAWLVRGGAEPEPWLRRYSDRLASAHVKDIAPSGTKLDEDGWADVGAGVLDWRELWTLCRASGAQWMVVEHDKPSGPERCVRASFAYLSKLQA